MASADVRLAAATGNVLNVPLNMAIDLVNVPSNEVQALDFLAKSLFFSGPWFAVSATNLWGVDPGDPSHFQSVVQLLVPFPALSGLGLDQSDQNGLGQQVWHTIAVILPVSAYCDAAACTPTVPTSPITGITGIDTLIWTAMILTGQMQYPLFSNWLNPERLSQLLSGGYTFDSSDPGYADPSGPVNPLFNFPGTTVGPNGENLMPWADTEFKLDLIKPFQNYFNHLMADPSTNPIQLPDLVQFGRSLQALVASMVVAFDPFTPGSPFCPGDCKIITDLHLDYPDIVRSIGALWPGNETIDDWLTAYDTGKANVPTQEQIDNSVEILQQGPWSFGNPSPRPEWIPGFNPSTLAPQFHALWTALGFNPPPLNNIPIEPEETSSVNALTSGPETQLKAKAIEKDPQITTTSAQVSSEGTPPAASGAATLTTTTGTATTGSGTATTGSGTTTTGSGTNKPGEGANTNKPGEGANKPGEGANKTGSGSGTSTGAHSGGGSAE